MNLRLIQADARHIPLEDESVQCVVTSPPYWGLRKYAGEQELIWGGAEGCEHEWQTTTTTTISNNNGLQGSTLAGGRGISAQGGGGGSLFVGICLHCGAWRGAYGLEPTVEMYVAHTVEILREIRRVLRKDGVCFFNLGDSYSSHAAGKCANPMATSSLAGFKTQEVARGYKESQAYRNSVLPEKNLVLMPSRVALAAQADGWWVRSMIVWAKPNPMPESVTDRPTDAYEHIIMLTKSATYYWDSDAVREPAKDWGTRDRSNAYACTTGVMPNGQPHSGLKDSNFAERGRNLRNVWTFATQPYSGAHFATFPEELPRRCILAATSAKGACMQCGAPWERVTRRSIRFDSGSGKAGNPPNGKYGPDWEQAQSGDYDIRMGPVVESQTIGWTPTCRCKGQRGRTEPCIVLDPFGGSGTTGRVAIELRRRAVLLDLAYGAEYLQLATQRTTNVQLEAFS